jgi:hypothetical protein
MAKPLDRGACNDEAVKAFGADIASRPIKGCQMIRGRVAGDVIRDPHQRQFDLERRCAWLRQLLLGGCEGLSPGK